MLRSSNKARKNEVAFAKSCKSLILINLKIFLLKSENVHERKLISDRFKNVYYRISNFVKHYEKKFLKKFSKTNFQITEKNGFSSYENKNALLLYK